MVLFLLAIASGMHIKPADFGQSFIL